MLAALLSVGASAFVAPLASRPAVAGRGAAANMQLPGGLNGLSFDQDGVFQQGGLKFPDQKKPVKLLSRLEQLGLLTSLYEAGLLSSAEEAGVFSKLEAAGAFSAAEKLLPLADKLNLLALLESAIAVPASVLALGGVALLAG